MDSTYIPSILRTSPGTAFSVSRNERKRYNSAYDKASTSRKRRHIAKHLRRKSARRAHRKRGTRRSYEADVVAPPPPPRKKSSQPVVAYETPIDPHMLLNTRQKMLAASERRIDRGINVQSFLDRQYGINRKPM
jgi:hypothetical protein